MHDLGWKVESSSKTAYCIKEDFSLSMGESKLYSLLMKRFKEKIAGNATPTKNTKNLLEEILRGICEEKKLLLLRKRADLIERIALLNLEGYGVLDLLLRDDSLEEIAVNGIGEPIRVYKRNEGWLNTNCFFTSQQVAIDTVNKLARPLGRRITYSNPSLNASLPDGIRLHASIPPLNNNGIELTIRKFSKERMSIPDLIQNSTLSAEAAAFLWLCALSDTSVLIAGNTGSGKTTLLNALFSFVPLDERIILIEETPEISIPHAHKISLLANEELKIGMRDLVHDSLRMRPDRVIIGEVRTPPEIQALFESLQSGQAKGCFATFHAQNSQEASNRLKAAGIPEGDLSAIDIVVVIRRFSAYDHSKKVKTEKRRVFEISEISNGKPVKLFQYDAKKDAFVLDPHSLLNSRIMEKLQITYRRPGKQLKDELDRRCTFIQNELSSDNNYAEFSKKVQGYMFG